MCTRAESRSATLNSTSVDNPVKTLSEMAGGNLLAVLDTVGRESTSSLGVHALKKTGRYVVVGLYGGTFKMPLPMLPQRAMTVRGSYVGSKADLIELLDLVRAGKVKPLPVTLRPLDQAEASLKDLAAGAVTGRIVLSGD